eukprot:TRINITY_DN730_c1_g2_i3.p2 TRINITY_DN730_c1_g2~~TRINITY_DN730_c1_g2_i3.p2  ORF type:complete len:192 (+),score=59.65 TRINITY_DN730_c1_g2_i3:582-1157(+)
MRHVTAVQVAPVAASLSEGDVYVLRCGGEVYIFQGAAASPGERMKGMSFASDLAEAAGGGAKVEVVTSDDAPEAFWTRLGGRPEGTVPQEARPAAAGEKALFRLSDASGEMTFEELARGGDVSAALVTSDDVFILDTGAQVVVVVGRGASREERLEALPRAQVYLNSSARDVPVARMVEGTAHPDYAAAFG